MTAIAPAPVDSSVPTAAAESSSSARWYELDAKDVLAAVGGAPRGLSVTEAADRLRTQGSNTLVGDHRVRVWPLLASQFANLITALLIAASIASALLGEWVDAGAIMAIVVLNGVIGFAQELNAARSMAALRQLAAPHATVLRDDVALSIAAETVVVGDVLILASGDLVAADARVLADASLSCIEATLTGESDAVQKQVAALPATPGSPAVALGDRSNMVFMGTTVGTGSGRAVVVATGMRSELGRIAGLLESVAEVPATPLQQQLHAFGRVLIWSALAIVCVHFGLGWLRGTPIIDLFMTSVSLAVAAVPEGLPAVVTVALSLGVMRMSRQRALMRTLSAVETLGSTTVVCTDKTGTLTMGEMTVRALATADAEYAVTGEGYGPGGEVTRLGATASDAYATENDLHLLATIMVGCNRAHLEQQEQQWRVLGDPTEGALLAAGAKVGVQLDALNAEQPLLFELPFDSDRKRSSVIRRQADGSLRLLCNGAPGPLLERCTMLQNGTRTRALTTADRDLVLARTSALASRALRVLASAYRELDASLEARLTVATTPDARPADADELSAEQLERDLVFVGLAGMYDPPRPDGKAAVADCVQAGIRVVMITGDHPDTAIAVARELGIAGETAVAMTGAAIDALTPAQLQAAVVDTRVYARVTAEHKLRVVRAWQASHAVVAMTGDGVNDAPALRGADVGIAMGRSGTEVTRQAADMIITDDRFATIVSAIREGRGVYDNIRKTLQYLLAGNSGELLFMTACVAIGLPLPLLPIHLLWINLVTDGAPAFCLAVDAIDAKVMLRPPRARAAALADRPFLITMLLTGVLTAMVSCGVFWWCARSGALADARTYAFDVLVIAELLRAFGARSERVSVWRIRPLVNWPLLAVVVLSIAFQYWSQQQPTWNRVLQTTPVPIAHFGVLLLLGAIPLTVLEAVKRLRMAAE